MNKNDKPKKLEILLIEDNEDDAELIESALDPARYRITNIWNGKAATDYLINEEHNVDVVLLDKNLPYKTGLEILKETGESGKEYAFIFLTMDNTVETSVEAMKLGALDFSPKSSGYSELFQMIEKVHKIHSDRMEKKEAEDALRASEDKYRTITDNINVGIFRMAPESGGKFIEVNPAIVKMFGYQERNEIIKITLSDLFQDRSESEKLIEKLLNRGSINNEEVQLTNKDGSIIYGSITVVAAKSDEGEILHFDGIIEDITERKKAEKEKKTLEEQLFQAQKMESIGRLAGGIAHDFNNILVVIMGFAGLLKMKLSDTRSKEGEAADLILKEARKAAHLIKQLLGFARGGKYNPVPMDINRVIQDNVKVSQKILEKKVKISYDFDAQINTIEGDEIQIGQILMNLIINAKDSMKKGGKLSFTTENMSIGNEDINKYPFFSQNDYVKLTISDTGDGMEEDVKERIFEPFFSTKEKGTGLGLSMVYGIVKNHGGHIEVDSKPGKGTTFTLYFPVSEKRQVEVEEKATIFKGEATILVVDDEENVRKYSEEVLNLFGYTVFSANGGREAVKIYKENKNKIDLILLDIIMPMMDGRATNLELRKINPDVKILLVSGYSQNDVATEILNEGALGFIQKPYEVHDLSKAIADALVK